MKVANLAVLACVLRATTKKSRQLFLRKKCTPENILATSINATVSNFSLNCVLLRGRS